MMMTVVEELASGGYVFSAGGPPADFVARLERARAAGATVPLSLLIMHPEIAPETWETLSEVRYRAPHGREGYVVLAASLLGETHSQGARSGSEDEVFARLIESTARSAAYRVACREGTPILRKNDDEYSASLCHYCGKWSHQHALTPSGDGGHADGGGQ